VMGGACSACWGFEPGLFGPYDLKVFFTVVGRPPDQVRPLPEGSGRYRRHCRDPRRSRSDYRTWPLAAIANRLTEESVLTVRLCSVVAFRGPVGLALISAAGWLAGPACERPASSPGSAAAWLVRGATLTVRNRHARRGPLSQARVEPGRGSGNDRRGRYPAWLAAARRFGCSARLSLPDGGAGPALARTSGLSAARAVRAWRL
jgi:hypothetical protein